MRDYGYNIMLYQIRAAKQHDLKNHERDNITHRWNSVQAVTSSNKTIELKYVHYYDIASFIQPEQSTSI